MLLYRFSHLRWNIEHLLGICRDFYRAYSDINVWVNSFLNIDPPKKNYSQSKGKSNTCAKEIFHSLILHTHFLLHLYLIPFFLYYIYLILTNSIFKTNRVIKINKDTEEEKKTLFDEETKGPSHLLKRTVSCFGKAKPFNQLTSYRDCHIVR